MLYQIENSDKSANSVDLDEVAHNEPLHHDLRCLQIQLFLSVVVKELNVGSFVRLIKLLKLYM